MYFLLNLSHCVKGNGRFCQILFFLTMPAHEIWSCHATQDAILEIFFFCPNSKFNIRKSHEISSGKLSTSEVISQKPARGGERWWKTPPVPLGLTAVIPHTALRIFLFVTVAILAATFLV